MLTLATLASELKIENVALIAAGGKAKGKAKTVKVHSVSSASSVSMSSAAPVLVDPNSPK